MNNVRIHAVLIGFSILTSLLSNAFFGSNIGEVSSLNRLSFTPRNPAFSIWGVIYTLLVVFCVFVAFTEDPGISSRGSLAVVCTLLLTAMWVPVFSYNTKYSLLAASVVLWLSFACGMWVLIHENLWTFENWAKTIAVDASLSLFTSWLGVASVIGTGIALQSVGVEVTNAVVLVAASSLSIVSIYLKNPVLPIGLLWGVIWMEKSIHIWASSVVLALTSILSLIL